MNKRTRTIIIGSCILLVALICIGRLNNLNAEGWASWVQAVGSIAAILVAVEVARNQNIEALRRSAAEKEDLEMKEIQRSKEALRGLLLGIRAEIETALKTVENRVGKQIDEIEVGIGFLYKFSISENSFPVFSAMLPSFGLIADHSLRVRIIHAYSSARSLILSFQMNNEMLDAYEAAIAAAKKNNDIDDVPSTGEEQTDSNVAGHLEGLIAYAQGLQSIYFEVRVEFGELIDILPSE